MVGSCDDAGQTPLFKLEASNKKGVLWNTAKIVLKAYRLRGAKLLHLWGLGLPCWDLQL